MKGVPGSFSRTLYDSGFGTTAFIRYPLRKETDLASSVFAFHTDLIVYFSITFLLSAIMISKLFERKLSVNDSFLVVFRIMFKGRCFVILRKIVSERDLSIETRFTINRTAPLTDLSTGPERAQPSTASIQQVPGRQSVARLCAALLSLGEHLHGVERMQLPNSIQF